MLVLLARRADLQLFYPVPRNPNVQKSVVERLGSRHVHSVRPLDYLGFVRLMQDAHSAPPMTTSCSRSTRWPTTMKPQCTRAAPESAAIATSRTIDFKTSLFLRKC